MGKKGSFWQSIRFKLILCFNLQLLFFLGVVSAFLYGSFHKIATSFIILGITFVIFIFVSILIIHVFMRPIDQLQKQSVRIYNGDYSKKKVSYCFDELNILGRIFNELADRIEKMQTSIEYERNRLNSVLKHMTDGVIATDRKGNIVIINEMALSQLVIQEKEAIGHSILQLLKIEKEYTLHNLLEDNPQVLVDFDVASGHSTFYVNFSIIRRDSDFIDGVIAVLVDVTQQQKTELERQQFVSNVSHELRTPLTSIHSYLEALSDGALKDEAVASGFLKISLKETERMIRMISDLLHLSKIDSGQTSLKLELVDFNDFINHILNRFEMMKDRSADSSKKACNIIRKFTKRTLWVEIDTDKMIQVIDNIINNALKYSPEGGKIQVRLIDTHRNVLLSISDQGLGIPKADLKKIFERFYRVDKARDKKQGGTGLGLSISKEIIQAHGGHIWAESTEEIGSTFYISLPYQIYEEEWE
ncbi:MAG: cell wall metabolism sensor histidine kinase WalK [Streptococcaceae bacterium]|nr:cell wall metabolism sensor histidine kinase WalK [Streptococcaceae bacterium]